MNRNITVYSLIVVFIAVFIFLSISRHDALKSFQNDLGTYSQLTWNTLHGHFFEASGAMVAITLKSDGTTQENFNYLSAHFSPLLLFFVPFYILWPNPILFLILQAIAVGLGGLPIYWLAKEKIEFKGAGLIFLISYLFYPVLHNALLYDFHEVTFAVPIMTFALWFWYKKKIGWMLFFLALLCLVQEHTALIVFMFGLYLAIIQKRKKLGFTLALISLIYFIIVVLLIIPSFSASGQSVLIRAETSASRYTWLGSSTQEIISTFIHKPFWVFQNMFKIRQIDFLITLFLPLFGLPIFSALSLLSLPILAIYFLSQYWLTYSIYFYHSSILTGIFYFAAIFAFARLLHERKWQKIFLALILTASLIVSYFYSVTPFGKDYTWKDYQPSANAKLIKEVLPLVPKESSLVVQHNLGPHFANRQKLFHFPFNLEKADYVVIDVYNPFAENPKPYAKVDDVTETEYDYWKYTIELLLNSSNFGVIYSKDGWLVFIKDAPTTLNEQAKKDFSIAIEKFETTIK